MAQVAIASSGWDDLSRLFEFAAQRDAEAAVNAIAAIGDGITLLEKHPNIGRPLGDGMRELIISYGATGYIALYGFDAVRDVVTVFKIRHQRELGYK